MTEIDWILNRLEVTGPSADMSDFVMRAEGPGFIDWRWNTNEDLTYWSALFLTGGAPSVQAADKLAGRIKDRLWYAYADARSFADLNPGAVPLDLNSLLPVPRKELRRGFGGGEWCWENWGTRYPLRHVTFRFESRRVGAHGIGSAAVYGFESANWSPWRAIIFMRETWPSLTFKLITRLDRYEEIAVAFDRQLASLQRPDTGIRMAAAMAANGRLKRRPTAGPSF